jgi:hypothetical protein
MIPGMNQSADALGAGADSFRDLSLEQAEVQPAFPDVVSYRTEPAGIGCGRRFLAYEAPVAKRQRRGVPAATWAVAASAAVARHA